MRTFANSVQVARLSWVLYTQGITDAKAHLEPLKYVVKGINYGYREVQTSLDTIVLLNGAIKDGKLKATKAKGFVVA